MEGLDFVWGLYFLLVWDPYSPLLQCEILRNWWHILYSFTRNIVWGRATNEVECFIPTFSVKSVKGLFQKFSISPRSKIFWFNKKVAVGTYILAIWREISWPFKQKKNFPDVECLNLLGREGLSQKSWMYCMYHICIAFYGSN